MDKLGPAKHIFAKKKTLDVWLPGLGPLSLECSSIKSPWEEGVKPFSPFVLGTSACIPPWNFSLSCKARPAAKSYIHYWVARQHSTFSGKAHSVVTVCRRQVPDGRKTLIPSLEAVWHISFLRSCGGQFLLWLSSAAILSHSVSDV